jgi:acyl transferase domain-containing protein
MSQYAFKQDSIAIIGAACRLPGANDIDELWDLISKGTSKCEEVRASRSPVKDSFRASQDHNNSKRTFYGNFIDDVEAFEYKFFKINAKEAATMDPQQRIMLELAYEAMDSSGALRHHQRERFDNVGCFIGASFTEYLENTSAHAATAYTATGTIRAFLCGKISYYFGWKGPSEVIDTACSSSLVAIHRACQAIKGGECPVALAGGINIITGIHNYIDLSKAGFLSPTGQCKPFDAFADGYCRADGAGLVVLKSLSDALAEGNQILGVITGVSTNQGGLSPSITIPHSPSQIELYRRVLTQSGMSPEYVTYVEAHGTGTQAGK